MLRITNVNANQSNERQIAQMGFRMRSISVALSGVVVMTTLHSRNTNPQGRLGSPGLGAGGGPPVSTFVDLHEPPPVKAALPDTLQKPERGTYKRL